MAGDLILLSVPLLPLLLAVQMCVTKSPVRALRFAPLGPLPALAAALALTPEISQELPWILFRARLTLDDTAVGFLFFTGILWLCGALQLARSETPRSRWFGVSFLFSMAGNMGVIVAGDAASFYMFFALMSFAAYGLIVEDATAPAQRAGRVYIWLVVAGEVALFAALILVATDIGSHEMPGLAGGTASTTAVVLIILGFGIKAGLVPVHVSLPLAYAAAPSPARLVLAGAMLNAGVVGWLRFLPLDGGALPELGDLLAMLGVVSVFYGVACGLGQRDARALLAYSSVSQMGYVVMLLGSALAGPNEADTLRAALLLFVLHHALAKGALFWGHDLWTGSSGQTAKRRLAAAGLILAAGALAGAPLTSGWLAKAALTQTLSPIESPLSAVVTLVLPIGAVATTLLMGRFLLLCLKSEGANASAVPVPPVVYAVLIALVAGTAWVTGASTGNGTALLTPGRLWSGVWPVILGVAIAGAGYAAVRLIPRLPSLRVPEGDLLALAEIGLATLKTAYFAANLQLGAGLRWLFATLNSFFAQFMRIALASALTWSSTTIGIAMLTLFLVFAALMLVG